MINLIDVFSGCGGLTEGFHQQGSYRTLSAIEWDKSALITLKNRFVKKYNHDSNSNACVFFDVQRFDELINGFDDDYYGKHQGLTNLINNNNIDVIIGGPPCQAYSIANRNNCNNDYRNFLFESYVKLVKHFRPKFFVFENVTGILSAKPNGVDIIHNINKSFSDAGYYIHNNMQNTIFDMSYYGVPQVRKRVIIFGVNKDMKNYEKISQDFYCSLHDANFGCQTVTQDFLQGLPKIMPVDDHNKISHKSIETNHVLNHIPRFHNKRDIEIFKILADDIESGKFRYNTVDALIKLYAEKTGKQSKFHKYNVIQYNKPSNTITAHLYKDGLRHIHPDSQQARTITVREAARIQTFDDDFEFIGSLGDQYKMIGNAVPPQFSKLIANIITKLL
jgi:DNA (cytosine-5)-methyltransferase 1